MQDIRQLPLSEQQHYILCGCGHYVDMRNLGEVFHHLHFETEIEPAWSHARKRGEARAHLRNGNSVELN